MVIILLNLNRFSDFFSPEDYFVNVQQRGYQKSHHTLHMLSHYLVKR